MSSYGEDYSDEEQNAIEHGGMSQGESEIEDGGEGEGEGVGEGSGGHGRGWDNTQGNLGWGFSEETGEANVASGREDFADSEGTPGDGAVDTAEGYSSNQGKREEAKPSFIVRKNPEDAPVENKSMDVLTAQEFCERLKLFESQRVTLLIGPEEVSFTIPKDLLCQNSTFFDRAFNGKFKEGVELTMHLPEDTVVAFQMMLQMIYTGRVAVDQHQDNITVTSIYLEFFKMADKIDLSGPLEMANQQFREHVTRSIHGSDVTIWASNVPRTDCIQECVSNANANTSGSSCSCLRDQSWGSSPTHTLDCDIVLSNCLSKEAHIDPLRKGTITSDHLQAAFELRPGHLARRALVQACVTSYILSLNTGYKFKFAPELGTLEGFCQSLLEELALARPLENSLIDPLTSRRFRGWWASGQSGWGN